jgi:hypothetical protein
MALQVKFILIKARFSVNPRVAGCAIVTPQDAFLFTDGRYFLQAGQQLDKSVTSLSCATPSC